MSNQAKGAVVVATLDYLRTTYGEPMVERVLEEVHGKSRETLTRLGATDEIPLSEVYELWRAADRAVGPTDPLWMENAGAHSITSKGVQLYSGIVRKPTPLEFLTQRVSLFRLFYHRGEMHVVDRGDGRAVLRLLDFDDVDVLFCRRQTGGLRRAVELAGGAEAVARHVRCVIEGDAFCEWELTWKSTGGQPRSAQQASAAAQSDGP
jgi:hypothetical protein